ncbi:hypothetical protein FNV43_RR24074 [Rhamnella rubrinervis]|uniref:Uncharacterized protein n=1 Tax=Rhamnella rubrinervis TaxID=2594499 RepID=A0A8K0GKV3_9ROSA|nr:hypothetical protein FNV43_RR24074 [Rhamnella rubrinervis]
MWAMSTWHGGGHRTEASLLVPFYSTRVESLCCVIPIGGADEAAAGEGHGEVIETWQRKHRLILQWSVPDSLSVSIRDVPLLEIH